MILTCSLTMLLFMLMGKRNLKLNLNCKTMTLILNLGHKMQTHYNHKMKIHYNKTSSMTLGSRHRTQNEASEFDITIDGNEIKQVDKQKLLGVYIDENLLWTAHIDRLHLVYNFNKNISLETFINICSRASAKAILSRMHITTD